MGLAGAPAGPPPGLVAPPPSLLGRPPGQDNSPRGAARWTGAGACWAAPCLPSMPPLVHLPTRRRARPVHLWQGLVQYAGLANATHLHPALPSLVAAGGSAFAAPPPGLPPPANGAGHGATGPTPFAAATGRRSPDDGGGGGGRPNPGGPPAAQPSFNLASLTSLFGGDISRLPQLAGQLNLSGFPSMPPVRTAGLAAWLGFVAGDAAHPCRRGQEKKKKNLPFLPAALLQATPACLRLPCRA